MWNSLRQFLRSRKFVRYVGLAIATLLLTWLFTLAGCTPQTNQTSSSQSSGSPQVQQTAAATKLDTINLAYQPGIPGFNLLKAQGLLEKRLAGTKVNWVEFRGGPPMIEAMAGNAIDIGVVGNLPPIFAQAANNPVVYVAATTSNAATQALLVPKDSSIQSLADLKGKKVAVQKGTALQYMLLKALAKAGLTTQDIQPVYLNLSDSYSAFESNALDALPAADPFYAKQELSGNARVIVTGDEVAPQRGYYIARRDFADQHSDTVKIVLEEVQKAEAALKDNPNEVAKLLAAQTKYDVKVWEWILKNRPPFSGAFEVKGEYIAEQQQVADLFYKEKLIPKTVQVKDAVWKP